MANTLAAELILDISKFRRSIAQAQNSVRGSFKGGGGIAAGIVGSTAAITTALVGAVSAAASVAGFQAGKIIAQGVAMAGEYEKIQMRFDILSGSREQGNRVLADLRADAMRTGVTFEDMTDNVAKFMAFGFNSAESVKLNKGILDIGGSVGLTTKDMKLLGLALSQVAAKGCHALDSEIRMHDGTIKKVQDIVPGDRLMGGDGGPRWVNYLARGRQMMFKVVPSVIRDGEPCKSMQPFVVNLDHKMRVSVRGGDAFTLTMSEYLALNPEIQITLRLIHSNYDGDVHFCVAPVGVDDFYGFNISGDHLYLDAQGFEHHNTANMEELRQQIAEKGIPIFKALEQQLGVTGAELSSMIQAGKVSSMDVLNLFTGAVDGEGYFARFQGGAERMASTFTGSIARMRTIWHEFLRLFGGPIMDSLKPVMDAVLVYMQALIPNAENWGQAVADAIAYIIAGFEMLSSIPWNTYALLFKNAFLVAVYEIGNQLSGVMMGAQVALQGLGNGSSISENFKKGQKFGSGIFDKDIKALSDAALEAVGPNIDRMRERSDELMRQQRERSAERNRIANGADFSDAATGASGGRGGFSMNGELSQAINVIAGRSAFSVIASEAIKANAQQEKANKLLETIEKNTRPKAGSRPLTVTKVQDMSRFA